MSSATGISRSVNGKRDAGRELRRRTAEKSSGKKQGTGGNKIGNAHLKWAFGEAACLMLRALPTAKKWLQRQERKRGKKKALSVLEAKIGRTVYHLLRKQQAFDAQRFFAE